MRRQRHSFRATAIHVRGAEQHLGRGKNTAFPTRRCNRHGTLAFLPFEANLESALDVRIRAGKRATRLSSTLDGEKG